jgi:hypothetical protein
MSWRYWSNAEEGDERKNPFDLLSVTCSIHAPYTGVGRWRASGARGEVLWRTI